MCAAFFISLLAFYDEDVCFCAFAATKCAHIRIANCGTESEWKEKAGTRQIEMLHL